MSPIADIESERRALNVSEVKLCEISGVGRQTYRDIKTGAFKPRPATLAKLRAGLRRCHMARKGEGAAAPRFAFDLALVLVATKLGADAKAARAALSSDPSKRATASPAWMQAAAVRRVAVWVTNQMAGFSQSEVARAAGLTKQAVSDALRALEWDRDKDPQLDRVLTELEEVFS